ncbi:uncharacterized protein LOC133194274 [Saccostrea echinata]|uniref:uncharacterized protein LOC133194274 n=1 Tax=Saccostrea echinata TaxID=191078 RepID=UPI002A813466|nr:uncharacterized protein LOC133194274 [Saccostrea echinata]
MEYQLYHDYFNLASQIVKNMQQGGDHPNHDVAEDLIMMDHRHGDDTDSLCNIDTISLDTSDDDNTKPDNSLFSQWKDPSPSQHKPLWMNFDNGDVFYSSNGEFPSMSDLTEEEGSHSDFPTSSCSLPYPKNYRCSPTFGEDHSSASSSCMPSRSSPLYEEMTSRSSPLLEEVTSESGQLHNLMLALQDLQYQGVVGTGLVNPKRPVFALDEKACALCKKNGETREFYTTHVLKDNRGKIICPILRKYVCPTCGATGDNAHTLRHCPVNKATENTRCGQ